MSVIRSKKERLKEEAEHPGQTKYRIFYKQDGKQIDVFSFWAATEEQARDELNIYRKKRQLVDPDDDKEYLYGQKGGWICSLGNGMEKESNGPEECFDDGDESVWEKICTFFSVKWMFLRDLKYFFADFWFWFKHYDMQTNKSHNRSESWSLDSHVLDDFEFNIPLLIRGKHGIPTEFCHIARAKLNSNNPDFDIESSFKARPNSSDEEFKLAETLWNEELEKFLLHVRLYRFYCDYGIVDERDSVYVKLAEEYADTIPYKPDTDKQIDYTKAYELQEREWKAIWEWWVKYGRCCWD